MNENETKMKNYDNELFQYIWNEIERWMKGGSKSVP